MKKILLSILLFLILGFLGFYFWGSASHNNPEEYDKIITYPSKPEMPKDTFTIMTYNIGWLSGMTNNLPVPRSQEMYQRKMDSAEMLLNRLHPDFVGFQEIDFDSKRSYHFNQLDSLGRVDHYHQGAMAVNWDKFYVPFPYWPPQYHFGYMYSGQATLSQYPIQQNDRVVLKKPINAPFWYNAFYLDRVIQINKIKLSDSLSFTLMNVHLEAFDTETRELQADHLHELFKSYAKDGPVLLVGDFNSRPPYASKIIEPEKTISYFVNDTTIGQAIPKAMYQSRESDFFTFDSGNPHEKIDFIFFNKDRVQALDARVLHEFGQISDHIPVWMKFRFK